MHLPEDSSVLRPSLQQANYDSNVTEVMFTRDLQGGYCFGHERKLSAGLAPCLLPINSLRRRYGYNVDTDDPVRIGDLCNHSTDFHGSAADA